MIAFNCLENNERELITLNNDLNVGILIFGLTFAHLPRVKKCGIYNNKCIIFHFKFDTSR